jgi:hypothetical protein
MVFHQQDDLLPGVGQLGERGSAERGREGPGDLYSQVGARLNRLGQEDAGQIGFRHPQLESTSTVGKLHGPIHLRLHSTSDSIHDSSEPLVWGIVKDFLRL